MGAPRDPAAQESAARQREMNRQLRSWTPRRVLGWALAAVAALVGVVHWLAHLDWRPIPLSMGWQDLLVGYPTAGLAAIAAAVLLGGSAPPHEEPTPPPSKEKGRISMRPTVPALVLASALLLAGCSQSGGRVTRTESGNSTGYIGGRSVTLIKPADRKPAGVVSGTSLDGKEISTTDYAGKVVVVNVWGSWCAPCRKEAPDLSAVSKKSSKVAQFVGINIRDMDQAPADAYVRAFDVSYPSIYDPDGKQLVKLAADLPPIGIPTTLIIDRKGRSAIRVIGGISEGTLMDMISDVADGK